MKTKHKEEQKDQVMFTYLKDMSKLKEENIALKQSIEHMQYEIDAFRKIPFVVAEVKNVFDNNAVIKLPNGNIFYVAISPSSPEIKQGDTVLVEQRNLTIVGRIPSSKEFNVENFLIIEKPNVKWGDVGGLKEQINEIKEVIELPLKNPELFKKVGITPPKAILLYGPPGTGKTLLAKAVASSTNSTFIEIVASELVQKFIGEGAKLVKEIFQLAREKAPSIIFIDEIDALASVRIDIGTSGEREVQRTFMQLLAEIDGFTPLENVKIIGCTNREDLLDPAITRPGRLDRKIELPLPNFEAKKDIFLIHSKSMNLKNVNVDVVVKKMEGFSGAEIKATCTEAGYFAIRNNRTFITQEDFLKAIKKVRKKEESEGSDYLKMFG